jgi:hypothetical protein
MEITGTFNITLTCAKCGASRSACRTITAESETDLNYLILTPFQDWIRSDDGSEIKYFCPNCQE